MSSGLVGVVFSPDGTPRYTQNAYDIPSTIKSHAEHGLCFVLVDGPFDPLRQYIGAVDRQAFDLTVDKTEILADGADIARITGLPRGVVVTASLGDARLIEDECNDGFVDFVTDQVGTHQLTLSHGHYITMTIKIVAVLPPIPEAEPEPAADQGEP